MGKIGILAFGSIITSPGQEIIDATDKQVEKVTTDFKVEFARSSVKRGGAPTLAVVSEGGSTVKGTLFILRDTITFESARNILLRREMNRVGDTSITYTKPSDWMEIRLSTVKHDECKTIIYAAITPNWPTSLAKLAIKSTNANKDGNRRDGIQYLSDVKAMGIITPLMKQYETEILRLLDVDSLESALEKTMKS